MNIDITKKYTTQNGLPVRVYAVDGAGKYAVHGSLYDGAWIQHAWTPEGAWSDIPHGYDLTLVKTWRAWKEGEAPVRVMLRQKGICSVETKRTKDCDLPTLFIHYARVHEDGSETPCGVEA